MVASENRGTWGLNQFVWKAQGRGGAGRGKVCSWLSMQPEEGSACDPAVLLEEKASAQES